MTNNEIAEIIGYKEGSVRAIACRLGVTKYYSTPDMCDEVWKEHTEYPDYLVSNKGRLKSKLRNKLIYIREHEGYNDCRIKDKTMKNRSPRIHRLVAEVFVGNPHNKEMVNHIDGNKLNNNSTNLEWSTAKENAQHAIAYGLVNYRTDTLTDSEVHNICKLLEDGYSYSKVMSRSDRYTRSRVEKIRQRIRWVRISKDYGWDIIGRSKLQRLAERRTP